MKKFKFFALAAIILATVSAFTTNKHANQKTARYGWGYYKFHAFDPNDDFCIQGWADPESPCSIYQYGSICTINNQPAYDTYENCMAENHAYFLRTLF